MNQYGHCCYYAQREDTFWCMLRKAAISEAEYYKHCNFCAKARCPLSQDLILSEAERKRKAENRMKQDEKDCV